MAAANRSGASNLAAAAYQKSPSVMFPTDALAPSHNAAAVRRAAGHVRDAGSGDQAVEPWAGGPCRVEDLDGPMPCR